MKKRRKKGGGTVISTALFEFAAPVNPGTWRHVVTWPGRLVRWLIRVDWTFRFYERICYFARARFDFQFNRISASVVCKQMKNDDRLVDTQIHWKKNLVKSETNLEGVARIFEDVSGSPKESRTSEHPVDFEVKVHQRINQSEFIHHNQVLRINSTIFLEDFVIIMRSVKMLQWRSWTRAGVTVAMTTGSWNTHLRHVSFVFY